MANENLKLAICQMNSVDSSEANFNQILKLTQGLSAADKVDMFCFPENSLFMRIKEGQKIAGLTLADPVFEKVIALAKKMNAHFHFGSIPLRVDGNLRNASVMVTPQGEVFPSYFKIHLFDIELAGQPTVRESDIYVPGEEPKILNLAGWTLGQTICYDLRFSELFNFYSLNSVEVILVPASFLVNTGLVHWEVLLRARAIESQAYIVAAAQAGSHHGIDGGVRETYGHSLVVDPWGQIIAEAKTMGPEMMIVELNLEKVKAVRQQIPMRNHRRLVKMKK